MKKLKRLFQRLKTCETCLPYILKNYCNTDDLDYRSFFIKLGYLIKYFICRIFRLDSLPEDYYNNVIYFMFGEFNESYNQNCSNSQKWYYIEIGYGIFKNWWNTDGNDGNC